MNVFFFVVMSFLNLTAAEFFGGGVDDAGFVDPTDWDYDHVTKGSRRHANGCIVDPSGWSDDSLSECTQSANSNNDEDNLSCESMLNKCRADVAHFQMRTVAAVPTDPSRQTNVSKEADNSSSVFIKRFINLLLKSARLLDDQKSTSGDIEIIISPVELKTLTDYSSSRIDVPLHELNSILTNIIHTKPLTMNSFTWKDMIYSIIVQKEVWVYLMILCVVGTFCRIILTVRTVSGGAKLVIVGIFIVSYLIEYCKMYKEVEIRQRAYLQRHPDVPDACNPNKQSLFFNMFEGMFSFKKDECVKYYKELWTEPFMEVSPLCVLSNIVTDFVLQPTGKLGKAIVLFSSVTLGELPFQYGWFIYLMSCFGIFMSLTLTLIILSGGSMRLGGLVGGLEVSGNRRPIASAPNNQPEPVAVQSAPNNQREPIANQSAPNNDQPEPLAVRSAPLAIQSATTATTGDSGLQRKTSASNTPLLLEAVGKTGSFVLMDVNSLQNILIQHRNEIEELTGDCAASCEPNPKKKSSNVTTRSEGPLSPLKRDSSFDLNSKSNLIDSKCQAGGLTSDTHCLKCSSLLSDCDKMKSEDGDVCGSPVSDKKEITAVECL